MYIKPEDQGPLEKRTSETAIAHGNDPRSRRHEPPRLFGRHAGAAAAVSGAGLGAMYFRLRQVRGKSRSAWASSAPATKGAC